MFQWFHAGGPTMWALLACSLLALAIAIEKGWNLRRRAIIRPDEMAAVRSLVEAGRLADALAYCEGRPGPATRILREALEHYAYGWEEMEKAVEHAGRQEASAMERHLNLLGVVAAAAPMLGLLGTVMGLIGVFQALGTAGGARAELLAGGIAQALIATVGGLVIGIPALALYHIYHGRIDRLVADLERHTFELFRVLRRGREVAAGTAAAVAAGARAPVVRSES